MTYDRGTNAGLIKSWLKYRFGEEGFDRVAEKLNDDARDMLVNPHANKWYPTPLIKEIYQAIYDEFAEKHPDALYDCGRYGAQKSATGMLRFLMKNISVENLLKRLQSFWKHYTKGGRVEAQEMEPEGNVRRMKFIVYDYNSGILGCQLMEGYIEEMANMVGAREVKVEKRKCLCKGDDFCSWHISWTP